MTGAIDELSVFEGLRPRRTGDLALEGQGIAPNPEDSRYGGVYRMFTVWFTPNMELSGVFAGTLAVVFGLGFPLGVAAIRLSRGRPRKRLTVPTSPSTSASSSPGCCIWH